MGSGRAVGGRLYTVGEKRGFRVLAPVGGSVYVDGERASRALLRVLWLYGYLAGSSLGSRGSLKMAHGRYGDVYPTGKLYLVLNEVEKSNPFVEMLWEAARGVWRVYGDGVKTVVLLAFKLYERAWRYMRDYGLRPSVVEDGYWRAYRIHSRVLEELAQRTGPVGCTAAARSLLTGSPYAGVLAPLLCKALERYRSNPCTPGFSDAVAFERIEGGSPGDSYLYPGVVFRKRLSRPGMRAPRRGPLRVVVVDQKLYVDLRYEGFTLRAEDPGLALRLADHASRAVEWVVGKLSELGVGVLVNVKGVDARLEEELERMGVLVLRRVPAERARLLARASGARLLSRLQDAVPQDVGVVEGVEERVYGDKYYTLAGTRGCASTIILRGPWYAVDSAYEEARMAARGLEAYTRDPRGLPAGGAPEAEAALRIREEARRIGGKQQLAMEAYAEAIETIPRTLARHSALDPEEALADLQSLHANGAWAAGVDEDNMEVAEDLVERGLVDLYVVRQEALNAALHLAIQLIRITGVAIHKRGEELRLTREGQR